MGKIVIELTNRCNLNCHHCFTGRHGGKDDLPLPILEHILVEAKESGFDELSFTGGDPTVYRHFEAALRLTAAAGYRFGLNTNGWNFAQTYTMLLPYREQLSVITFSLDGATEMTHDRLRGKNSFRRVMQAMSICMAKGLPFTINMVVTAHNRHEVAHMADLATRLGSRGLRFGHLMPAPITTAQDFDLSPWQRKEVEAEIRLLARQFPIPIAMAPGYHTTDLFPCAPLQMEELNVNCYGELSKCCHLSGHGDGVGQGDVMGNLAEISFSAAVGRLQKENSAFHLAKLARLRQGQLEDSDFFPCWYCSVHFGKVNWLQELKDHPWQEHIWTATNGAIAETAVKEKEAC